MTWKAAREAIIDALEAKVPTHQAPGYPPAFVADIDHGAIPRATRRFAIAAMGLRDVDQTRRTVTTARLVLRYEGVEARVSDVMAADALDIARALAGVGDATVGSVTGPFEGGALVPSFEPDPETEQSGQILSFDLLVDHL